MLVSRSFLSPWMAGGLALILSTGMAVLLKPSFNLPGQPMDEAILLVYPDLLGKGKLPYRDFETVYSPGNIWLLKGVYQFFGNTVVTERAVGLAYLVSLALALFFLARKLEPNIAPFSGLVAAIILISIKSVVALASIAALALAIWSFVVGYRPGKDYPTGRDLFFIFCGGLLAGAALLFRLDLGPAVLAAAAVLLLAMKWRERFSYIAGFAVALLPLLILVCFTGFRAATLCLFTLPVLVDQGGASLPLHGPNFALLITSLALTGVAVMVSGFLVWQRKAISAPLLLAGSLFVLGASPQALHRADEGHVLLFAAPALAWSLVPISQLIRQLKPAWRPALIAIGVFAAAFTLLALVRYQVLASLFQDVRKYSYAAHPVRVQSREFPLDYRWDPPAAQRICERILRLAKPGQRLFVGPHNLRRTTYNDAFFYYLLPDLEPATFFLEMGFSASRPGSRLSADIATADWLILDGFLDTLVEPNASRESGSDEPIQVIIQKFTIEAQDGNYVLGRRKHTAFELPPEK